MAITVCPVETGSISIIERFVDGLSREAKVRNLDTCIQTCTVARIRTRIEELARSGKPPTAGKCLLLVFPSRSQAPESETLSMMADLEDLGVQFRRAYADDPLKYSIPDQLPSMLLAAGGAPHRAPMRYLGNQVWTIGVDLAHWHGKSTSVLSLSLVDGDGLLAGAWTARQRRDETASAGALQLLLKECSERMHSLVEQPHVLVLRDGRMFENEDAELYRRILNVPLSLVEFRKRRNPQVIISMPEPEALREPFTAMIPGTRTLFIGTCPPRDDRSLIRVSKITWEEDWNGLELSPQELARLLFVSSSAPGLGLHPKHLPSALYWADGIAGASDNDLRFRGMGFRRLGSD